ncbi:SMI1/KNR4 family protein [Bacillus sp. B1-b2]|uniref:SMI1/KNR4 family protein n=1 Tax=Bacillus sp. B1-b2 TaxID=2653201 RepID=UPI001262461C|nr:SMI1/KNR4 family protein [Bacillus sp. B1-b2]KAB7668740.1 SMI1/KNR4 family protein [Bacillus sp. B1-b2]
MKIWNDEWESSYTLKKLTDEDINLAEKHFNVKLPQAYIDLLKKKNGGDLLYNALPISLNRWEDDDHILIDHLLGIKKKEGIMETDYYVKEWEINRKNIILLSGDGHEWLALDYNSSEEPKIIFIQTDEDQIITIYDSFEIMLEHLYIHEVEEDGEVDGVITFTLEEVRELVSSKEAEDIIRGLEGYHDKIYEEPVMVEYLDKIIRLLDHNDSEVVEFAGEKAYRVITEGYNVPREFIDKIKSVFGQSDKELFETFLMLINDSLNEQ